MNKIEYNSTIWVDDPSIIKKSLLNNIEEGISNTTSAVNTLIDEVEELNEVVDDLDDSTSGLQSAIDTEATRAKEVEDSLRTDITANASSITNLTNDFNEEVGVLETAIKSEEDTRTANDAALQLAIENEVSRAKEVEDSLRTDITNKADGLEDKLNKNVVINISYNYDSASNTSYLIQTASNLSTEETTSSNIEIPLATSTQPGLLSTSQLNILTNALQTADISTGTENGTISVKGSNVSVYGLTDTAYTDKNYFAADSKVLHNSGDQALDGSLSISGNAVISGNLSVSGTTTTTDAETLTVQDNLIITNSTGVTLTNNSGIAIKTGNEDEAYAIVYDPTSTIGGSVKLGLGTINDSNEFVFNSEDGYPVATRADSSDLTDKDLLEWDGINYKLVDSGLKVSDINEYINTLTANLNTEISNRETADTELQSQITTISNEISEKQESLKAGDNITISDGVISATIPTASSTTLGGIKVGNNLSIEDGVLSVNDVDLSGYVPTSRTINNKALTANISLTKEDIGLGNVDNTSDEDKPVSTATQEALNNLETSLETKINEISFSKQDALNETQLAAINSGITSEKVAAYDAYATSINTNANNISSLEASVVTNANNISTNTSNISGLSSTKADKSTTYTKEEVNELIADVGNASITFVDTLPDTGEEGTIYFVGTTSPYEMYVYENDAWVDLGSTDISMDNYYTKTAVDNLLANKQDNLTASQLNAVNSGITSTKVTQYDDYVSTIASNTSAINTEITNRENADTVLQANIDAEAQAREDADKALEEKISEISKNADAVTYTPQTLTEEQQEQARKNINTTNIKSVEIIRAFSIEVTATNCEWSNTEQDYIEEDGTAILIFTSTQSFSATIEVTNATSSWDSNTGYLTLSDPTGDVVVSINNWLDPIQTDSTLYIQQVYSTTQTDNTLSIE